VFFDFDESAPGYLAYDVAVFLWSCIIFDRKDHPFWHAFIEGYRSNRELPHADFEAAHLFVPIRHIWLMGEWASHIPKWGSHAVPADWIAAQLDFMLAWERRSWRQGCFEEYVGRISDTIRGSSIGKSGSVIRHATHTGGGLRLASSLVELPRMGSANPPHQQ
jgi:hypothetical protein